VSERLTNPEVKRRGEEWWIVVGVLLKCSKSFNIDVDVHRGVELSWYVQ
jgi:hypothetical protein